MSLLARDLETENAALRSELQQTRAQLRRMDDIKRSFTALAAHELRTPLTILFGYSKLLTNCPESERQKYAAIISEYAWQLKNTIDAVIVLQRIDAGELVLRQEVLPLGEIVEMAVASRQREIAESALEVQSDSLADLYVRADRERLVLILTQLLANAIKFSPHASAITIEAYTQQASVVIRIRDNGTGIPAEELPHVFDRFYQTGNPLTRQYNGLGLGLAVAKALVELHGGRIWVESELGRGSVFCFSLPRGLPTFAEATIGDNASRTP
jgi:two-component system, NarL family, sensor histidine kinase BarA